MRYICVAVLLVWATGSADVSAAQERPPAVGGPQADVPEEFRFLFLSPEQRFREAGGRGDAYMEELWKGLPYDSISLERGFTGGCIIACGSTRITLHRATISGTFNTLAGVRGRAELRTVTADMTLQVARTTEQAGLVDIGAYANLSYLLHKLRFLELPDRYYSAQARFDVPFTTLTVVAHGKTKAVTDYGEGRPIELWAIQQALDAVSKSIQWSPPK